MELTRREVNPKAQTRIKFDNPFNNIYHSRPSVCLGTFLPTRIGDILKEHFTVHLVNCYDTDVYELHSNMISR